MQPLQNNCPSGVVETNVGIYPHHTNRRRRTHVWRMKTKTLLQSIECTDINPLYKLRPIGGNPVSNLIFFNRGLQPEEFLDWIAAVEEVLKFKGVPKDRRVSLVATKFRGQAATWWQQLKQSST